MYVAMQTHDVTWIFSKIARNAKCKSRSISYDSNLIFESWNSFEGKIVILTFTKLSIYTD